ncbi:protocadherin Fat 3-like [Nymphalis io]|uniref:protocadherin Fat 3-like n=1 Tax=Inachis io TaxID=171585 RepID=UPI0021687C8E|nr:protocadherin Fat 3-like [Nymphalis io]
MDELLTHFIILLLFGLPLVKTEDRCAYMTNIPREPKPEDLPDIDFEGKPWSERPFIPAPERDDVCMGDYFPNIRTQVIHMDEEIEGDVAIAKLNYYGTATPVINRPLLAGSFNMLGPMLRKVNNEWLLYITKRQDYETPDMQVYMFRIQIEGESVVGTISLQIVNIDDNPPIIHILDSCLIPELEEPRLTDCIYEVTDEDGEISTSAMTFKIDSDRNDDQIFYILGQTIPTQLKRMTMTLGLSKSLDFETNALHIFRVTAFDSLPNNHTVTVMVQVQNVEHRPPRWLEIFAVQQMNEKTAANFTVRAIDGDTGIDKPIYYRLQADKDDEKYFDIKTIEGGRDGGIFQVFPIDRDALERELFRLSLIAYKYDNTSFATANNVVIIIDDVNDQYPEPLHKNYTVNIDEETPQTLHFDKEFGFHDKDLGQHAQYKVHLESVKPPGAAAAFFIQPEVGYQRQTFIMGTSNHSMLDYEIPEYQHIEIKVVATDMDKPEFVGVATVFINLINWNDELPIFENSIQTVKFKETEGEGFFVASVKALDRDIGDRVVHSIMGTAQNILEINEDSGDIFVATDDAFDYHRQSELLVQVRAEDRLGEPYNTATSQLVIQLEDVNNTPPTLRLPRGSPQVEENVPEGFPITQGSQEIIATDPDTSADLRFEIIWNTSYATKQGRETHSSQFYGCVEIKTEYPNPDERGTAVGRLFVKEIRPNVTIDYEEFEVLYLSVRVVDYNTEIGQNYDELTYTITIVDMNDNAPQWVSGSLTQELRVRENSATHTIIGSVQATDIDGPLYNQVRYTMRPKEGTPDNLVKIDFQSGQIEVDLDGAIDADTPPRYNLYFVVVASDKCSEEDENDCPPDLTYFETEGNITIQIIDTNNKNPMARTDKFETTVYLYENAKSGDEVVVIKSEDLDRDEIYNTVSYQINYAVNQRLRDFFAVDLESGRVFVDLADESLDRDGDEPTHRIFLTLIDNFYSKGDGNRNQNTTEIEVVLLDINDNAPELPSRDQLYWSISENLKKGEKLSPYIHARDRDEPNTDNSRVGYEINALTITNRDIVIPDLFEIVHIFQSGNIYNVSAELETAVDLRGYWGTYDIHIRAFDHGDPPLDSEEKYELIVRPYNFHSPVFVFPKDGTTIRLARERAVSNGLLVLVTGEFLDRIHATDEDGLHAGRLSFEITGDDAASQYFNIVNDGENQGTLTLRELFTESIREFQIRIRATDGGTEPGPLFTEVVLSAVFVPTQGEPTFQTDSVTVAFVEQEVGLTEKNELPLAEDPKNYLCNNDCHDIFYRIISGNDEGHFALDPFKNILSLNKELIRSESKTHTLQVAAANSEDGTTPLGNSILTVTVTVREANPRPYFVRKLYTAGISTLDTINRELLTVQATHSDGLPIVYTIDFESMVIDPSLSNVRDSAFTLHSTTGVLTLNMQPTASMHGMFEFNVVAKDPAEAQDTAAVKIYLISSLNRVFFIFVNALQQVESNKDFIGQTFSTGFNMTCNIDQVLPATDSAGVVRDDLVEVRAHFIRNDVPVPTDVIEDIRSDTQLLRAIQTTLNTELLVLRDFVTGASPEILETSGALFAAYALAALSALLGLLCIVLFAAYIIRTRALNRRLQALSMTKYGSQESGLNRLVLAAPGTNKHATEGSNPIWNEAIKAPDFDAISEQSDDSDLIGIENLPQFRSDYFPPADNNSIQEMSNDNLDPPLAAHNNNFGFNPTPFTPEFANKPFRHK